MMISMVDTDGDGQVSYEEFHRLIIDPDPSRADFGTEPTKDEPTEAATVTQVRLLAYRMIGAFADSKSNLWFALQQTAR